MFLQRGRSVRLASLHRIRSYHSENGVYGFKSKPACSLNEAVGSSKIEARARHSNLFRLVTAFREHGHSCSKVDPLGIKEASDVPHLDPAIYGLNNGHELFDLNGIVDVGIAETNLKEVVEALNFVYCGTMSVEFMHVKTTEEKEWFAEKFEAIKKQELSNDERIRIASLMSKSQQFDHFVDTKFKTIKRYGGEGGESAMPFYDELFRQAAHSGVEDIIICIAHRGRLNLLACLLKYPPVEFFRKMSGMREFPQDVKGSGDVLSHLTSSVDLDYDGKKVHVTMVPNPSHLESVNAVALGKVRARMQRKKCSDYSEEDQATTNKVLCFQIHGDAAFAGQGIVAECFALSDLPHYSVDGSVHFIHNNQLGFTTEPTRGRSSLYTSCTGKMNGVPVIRVNGDFPEEVVKACRLATDYRNTFNKDIIVDYMCYRKHGHNELDDPSLTQPKMYSVIKSRQSIPDMYAAQLEDQGVCTADEIKRNVDEWNSVLLDDHGKINTHNVKANHLEKQWQGLIQAGSEITFWDTGLPADLLRFIGAKSVSLPDDFNVHPTLTRDYIPKRLKRLEQGSEINWAMAEALAIGSLLYQGYNVRISGQDVGRGTFSHRHAMFVDQQTDEMYVPLNHMLPDQTGFYEVCNSILSEEAVLGFEYGVSIENPNILPIWEAQFGDFFNGAQIIIDTFICNGETKWLLQSGLVLLLPHGMDGAGPEHSSCKIERFLQLCDSKEDGIDDDDINMQIAHPTTPAQYYHLLRRQMVRNYRKPLIVASPKKLLTLRAASSDLSDMTPGTTFEPVLTDDKVNAKDVRKVVIVSGKHYYALLDEREKKQIKDIAIIRLEQLCPFPALEIKRVLGKFSNATEYQYTQEEHRNQGPWSFIAPRFENILGLKLKYSGRGVSATSATGVAEVHHQENEQLMKDVFS